MQLFGSDGEEEAMDEEASADYWASVALELEEGIGSSDEEGANPAQDDVAERGLATDPATLQAAGELIKMAGVLAGEAWSRYKHKLKKPKTQKGKGGGKGRGLGRPSASGSQMLVTVPPHWVPGHMPPERWRMVPISSRRVKATLEKFLKVHNPAHLGVGRDQVEAGRYSSLQLEHAWRLEHEHLWPLYCVERERVVGQRASQLRGMPQERTKFEGSFPSLGREMPGPRVDARINEKFLLHGTKPDTVIAILQGGLNERYSGGLFGNAVYLAEDAEKIDQYVTSDRTFDSRNELHRRLYRSGSTPFVPKVFYCFVVRAVLGFPCKTKDGTARLDDGGKVFGIPGNTRVLGYIPDTVPANTIQFHSLIAELGGKLSRHREFMVFDGDRIYPEYLLAYRRV